MQISRFARYFLLAALMLLLPASSFAGVFISVAIAPPALPVYVQPACPGDGYIWTPGYWAYGPAGYYWVPGTWVLAPRPGLLWTPGYWGWSGGVYVWHAGYWGPHVGFYGGVNYGFGYFGVGFGGGYWHGGTFFYNRSVTNVTITNVHIYNRTVNNVVVNRVSYNGGAGGIMVRPNHEEMMAEHDHHFEPTSTQIQHEHSASTDRQFFASVNHGRPALAATARPGEFHAAPRPENSERNMERHESLNRGEHQGGWPHPDNRVENHGNPVTHPAAYHPENHGSHEPRANGGPHENARPERDDHDRR